MAAFPKLIQPPPADEFGSLYRHFSGFGNSFRCGRGKLTHLSRAGGSCSLAAERGGSEPLHRTGRPVHALFCRRLRHSARRRVCPPWRKRRRPPCSRTPCSRTWRRPAELRAGDQFRQSGAGAEGPERRAARRLRRTRRRARQAARRAARLRDVRSRRQGVRGARQRRSRRRLLRHRAGALGAGRLQPALRHHRGHLHGAQGFSRSRTSTTSTSPASRSASASPRSTTFI